MGKHSLRKSESSTINVEVPEYFVCPNNAKTPDMASEATKNCALLPRKMKLQSTDEALLVDPKRLVSQQTLVRANGRCYLMNWITSTDGEAKLIDRKKLLEIADENSRFVDSYCTCPFGEKKDNKKKE